MRTYGTYKDSGVQWIGEIPEHWEVKRLKYVAKIQGRIGFKGYSKSDLVDEGALTIGAKHIDKRNLLDLLEPEHISWEKYYESPEIMVKKGDILVTQRGSLGKVAFIDREIGPATINPSMLIVKDVIINSDFLFKFFSSNIFIKWVELVSGGSGVPMISQEQLYNFSLSIPPLTEQTAIANYLDTKTTEIDQTIADKESLVDLYEEEKKALINEAVTKGLTPNVKLKSSSIDWLGDIPEHWEVKKLKYVGSLRSGENITSEMITDEDSYPVYGGNGLRGYSSNYTHEGDFILIGRQGALCGNINYAKGKFWASEHAVVVTINDGSKFFWLGELLREMNLNQYSLASAQPGLAVDRIQNLHIPVPPIKEQTAIVQYIEIETAIINDKITLAKQEIELLKEYRQALIFEAVTGKIKVSD